MQANTNNILVNLKLGFDFLNWLDIKVIQILLFFCFELPERLSRSTPIGIKPFEQLSTGEVLPVDKSLTFGTSKPPSVPDILGFAIFSCGFFFSTDKGTQPAFKHFDNLVW